MREYVKWCNSVEDLAVDNDSNVTLRTLRYSAKKLSSIPCFHGVKSKVLSIMVFLNDSLIRHLSRGRIYTFAESPGKVISQFHPPRKGVGFLGVS